MALEKVLLKALSCAYKDSKKYAPGRLFPKTFWDSENKSKINYSIKLGNGEKSYTNNKPTKRWRLDEKRPDGKVFLFDVNRVQSIESVKGYAKITKSKKETSSRHLEETTIEILSEIMGKSYSSGKYVKTEMDDKVEVGILSLGFGELSQFHQGTGESITFDLLAIIEALPNNSLILIDEIESSLHPKAQRKLIRTLLDICVKKKMQIVFTTHSEYILNEVPSEFRILLKRLSENEIVIMKEPSTEFCLTSMDEENHEELIIVAEDSESISVVKEIIRQYNSNLLPRIEFTSVGSEQNIKLLNRLAAQNKFPFKLIGILDADIKDDSILHLPGDNSPEKEILRGIIKNKLTSHLTGLLGRMEAEIENDLQDCILITNHHLWMPDLSRKWTMDKNTAWDNLVRIWVKNALSEDDKKRFMGGIESNF